ncbi:hypothetical protein Franean1_0061 [Parafrankia sp. EAN1pec]|uniref:hypothetical protein n=1 Tax=Parafrankia sp. (strain EAN1pec) TaxID=298653 RepID=UPI0000542EE7|nr:hypothetical protein Franean1_0061 [Frankia sp. EAN1pec]
MGDAQPSAWARERFGAAAVDFSRAVPEAIHRAHELALDGHVGSRLKSNDAYGAALHVQQYEQLAAFTREIESVALRKPVGFRGRFELVVLDSTAVVLYPWRYATDRKTPRGEAKMRRVSDLRKNLLTLTARTADMQLTFDHAELDPAALEAQFTEEQAVLDQLSRLGRVVTIGYASSPALGVFDLGWGDAELVDESSGAVVWHTWELLRRGGSGGAGVSTPKLPAGPRDPSGRRSRFDDAPLDDTFPSLAPRAPLAEPPTSEPGQPERYTGSDDTE